MARMRDAWEVTAIGQTSKEHPGYTTQKPLALLERIIKASSNESDIVFDPFCSCATTLEAANRLVPNLQNMAIEVKAREECLHM